MAAGSIVIGYGYSGDEKGKTPQFPDGFDYNKMFQMAAQTLAVMLRKWFGPRSIRIVLAQTWSTNRLLQALKRAEAPIHQVHIFCHGDSTRLSLAYDFDKGRRLKKRAARFNAMSEKTDAQRAYMQWAAEDAIASGYFRHYFDRKDLAALRAKHAKNANWQIWGCFAGYETDKLGRTGDPAVDTYLRRFGLGRTEVEGIAIEIAKHLGVVCTATKDGAGLEFWIRDKRTRRVRRTGDDDPALEPYWLWSTRGSKWVSYDATGKLMNDVIMFQWIWAKRLLTTGPPPQWMIDGYGP
jgi:hypothetical protein